MSDASYPPGLIQTRLANERTLLAWLRTGIALMGFGVMIARFTVFLDALAETKGAHVFTAGRTHGTGAALLLTGSLVTFIGYARTRAYARIIDPERRAPGDAALMGTALLIGLLGVGLAWLMVRLD